MHTTERLPDEDPSISESDLERIITVVDRFASSWDSGRPRRIEDEMTEFQEPLLTRLFRELVALELELRRRCGELPTEAEYKERFPDRAGEVRRLFRADDPSLPPRLDRYELLEELGAGGMGVVYKARHRALDRVVALKMMPGMVLRSEPSWQRFRQEVRALARLSHPNIIAAHDAEYDEGRPFLVMEFVPGEDLYRAVARRGPLPLAEAVDAIFQAARGLEHAHEKSVVHRDVKPSNLLQAADGTIKVLDLGLARLRSDAIGEATESRHPTRAGDVMGTAAYMAPEQTFDAGTVDLRADIYSLACTLHYLLTGRPPFQAADTVAQMVAHREAPIPSLRDARREVPPALDGLFRRMMDKQPDGRPSSMTEVIERLAAIARGLEVTPSEGEDRLPREAPAREAADPRNRILESPPSKKWQQWLMPVCVVVLAIAALAGWLRDVDKREAPASSGADAASKPAETKAADAPVAGPAVAGPIASALNAKPAPPSSAPAGTGATPVVKKTTAEAVADPWRPGQTEPLCPGLIARPAALPGVRRWQVVPTVTGVRSVAGAVSKDGRMILVASYLSSNLRLYEVVTSTNGTEFRLKRIVRGTKHAPRSIAWTPAGDRFAMGSHGGNDLIVVENIDGNGRKEVTGHKDAVNSLDWNPEGTMLASASSDRTVRIWDSRSERSTELAGHSGPVLDVIWSQDGRRLASADESGMVRIWDAEGHGRASCTIPDGALHPMAWSPRETSLAIPGKDGVARVLDHDGKEVNAIRTTSKEIASLTWSPDGKSLTVGSRAGEITLWGLDGRPGPILQGHSGPVRRMAWSVDGSRLLSTSDDHTTRIWDAAGKQLAQLGQENSIDQYVRIFWSRDSNSALTIDGYEARKLDRDGRMTGILKSYRRPDRQVDWSSDNRSLAMQGADVRVWDVDTGASRVFLLGGNPWGPSTLKWQPRGRRLAAVGWDGESVIWNEAGVAGPVTEPVHRSARDLEWSPDGKQFATAHGDGTIRTYSSDGFPGPVFEGHKGEILDLSWSPDGRRIASVGGDWTVRTWSLDGTEKRTVKEGMLGAVAWRPDGQRLVVGPTFGEVKIYDSTLSRSVTLRSGSENTGTNSLSWDPGGAWFASGDRDGKVRIWESDGTLSAVLDGHDEIVESVSVSPDGKRLASNAIDGVCCIWDTATGKLERAAILMRDGSMAVFGPGGKILHGARDAVEGELVYFIEEDSRKRLALRPSEFAVRFKGATP
ncbi:MAG: protein kinase [Isosphaeraceae bacterium]